MSPSEIQQAAGGKATDGIDQENHPSTAARANGERVHSDRSRTIVATLMR
jgi:hypothetical protein